MARTKTEDIELVFQIRDKIWHALFDLQINAAMWERARQASFRLYGSQAELESAVHATARALIHYQIVLLYKFWEKKTGDGNKASLPIFANRARVDQSLLVECIASKQLFLTESDALEFRQKRAKQLARLIAAIDRSETSFCELITKVNDARNDILAHNLFMGSEPLSMDIFKFRWFSSRTIRLCSSIILGLSGPAQNSSVGLSKRRREAVDAFWTRIEGERSKRFS